MTRFSLTFLGLAAALGCGSSNPLSGDAGGACTVYTVPAGTSLDTPTVSFASDVLPLFEMSCGLSSSCHGTPNGARVYLGSSQLQTAPSLVRAGIVGVATLDLPTMPYVTASDPTQSFLMHKMDGDACTLNAGCTGGDCGVSMPQDLPLLAASTRLVVRRSIAEGAADN